MLSFLHRVRPGRRALATAASALVPALLLGTTGPAVAATNTLTITAINRSGTKIAVTTTVVNQTTMKEYRVRSGTKRALPKGSYTVLAQISTGTQHTLGGRTVKVSGASKLTIDARQGRLINLKLSPAPAGLSRTTVARICTAGGPVSGIELYANGSDSLYVIPSASKKLAFATLGSWSDGSSTSDGFAVFYRAAGVPANPSRTFSQARLGTVTVESRRGPAGTNTADVSVQPVTDGCGDHMHAGMSSSDRPHTTKLRLSAGKWEVNSSGYTYTKNGEGRYINDFTAKRTIAASKSYFVRFHGAGWGPSTELPVTIRGRISFYLEEMFEDPAFNSPHYGGEAGYKATATLKLGGKVVKTKKGVRGQESSLQFWTKKAGWYTLTASASRYYPEITYPSGMLSTASSVTYRFHSKPTVDALAQNYSIQYAPAGLDSWNRASAGSTTKVALKLARVADNPDAKRRTDPKLKTLTTKASFDGGKTWKSVPVKKIGGTWTAVVPNPAAGAVALRTRATYASGGYTEVSLYRVYAIG